MLKKLLAAMIACGFAMGAYAQAPKADTKTEARKDGDKKPVKKTKSTKSTKAKSADAKDSRKDAPKEPKKEAK